MRVGLVIYGSLDFVSGGYLYDRMLVKYLRERGDPVDIVSLPWRGYVGSMAQNLSGWLRKRLRRADWEVLLQDELNHPSLFQLNRSLRAKVSYPIISIVHHLRSCEAHPAWKNRFHRQVEARYLNSVDGFIFNSRTTRSEVEKLVGASKPHVVAYPGRDHFHSSISRAQIAKRAKESRPLRILFLGNVIPRKGLHTLLEALALVPPEIWRLEVLGRVDIDRSYTEAIRRQIVKTGIGRQVEFRGPLPEADVTESLTRGHILAVPSSYEGFGITYLEGMGFGLPAIASTAGAAAELIADGEEGFLIAPNDAPNLARCIQMFSQNRDRLLQMSLKALERHRRFPSWEESMGSVRRLLEVLVQGR